MIPLRTPGFLLLTLCGCATAQTGPPATPGLARSEEGSPPDAPETRRVRGVGWSMAVPSAWREEVNARGVTVWRTETPPGQPGHRTLSVELTRGAESFEEMVAQLPGEYRLRGGSARHRLISHRGRPTAEFEVQFPARTQQYPTYYAVLVEGTWGLLVTCGGEPTEGLEAICRETHASATFGAGPGAGPPSEAPAGSAWFGANGRYVRVPEGWHPMRGPSAPTGGALGMADEGERHAVVLHFLDDIAGPPEQVLERARGNIARDTQNTILRTQPVRDGRRVGLHVDAVRNGATIVATTVVQWMMAAAPGAFFSINCGGVAEDMAAHPEVCRDILSTFTPAEFR